MKTVNLNILRHGALALALLAGAALMPQAASAGSLQDRGDFGGTWIPIAPSDHYHWRYAGRYHDYGAPIYVAPDYAYGPSIYDADFFGPPISDGGPDIALVPPEWALPSTSTSAAP